MQPNVVALFDNEKLDDSIDDNLIVLALRIAAPRRGGQPVMSAWLSASVRARSIREVTSMAGSCGKAAKCQFDLSLATVNSYGHESMTYRKD